MSRHIHLNGKYGIYFELILTANKEILFLASTAILDGGRGLTIPGPPPPHKICFNFVQYIDNGFRGGDFQMNFRENQLNLHIFVKNRQSASA
jgi:hypothetical protein